MIDVSLRPNRIICGRESEVQVCLVNGGAGRVSRLRFKLKGPLDVLFTRGAGTVKVGALAAGDERCHDLLVKGERAGTFAVTVTDFSYRNARGEYEEFPDQTLSLTVEEAPAGGNGPTQDFGAISPKKMRPPDEIGRALAAIRPRLLEVLARCGPFENNATLRDQFGDPRLWPWRRALPERRSRQERIEATVSFLQERKSSQGEWALVLFLEVLAERIDPGDLCRQELEGLIETLKTP
ncbi:MAG: hypothetical protein R3248_14295 [Candidatus Promineifilaceae bacterium]|nr:hypothetical protein [Candidatus Promineifilaceae bacterium]